MQEEGVEKGSGLLNPFFLNLYLLCAQSWKLDAT